MQGRKPKRKTVELKIIIVTYLYRHYFNPSCIYLEIYQFPTGVANISYAYLMVNEPLYTFIVVGLQHSATP